MEEQPLQETAFPRLNDADLELLARFGKTRVLRDGEILYRAGERGCEFFVIKSGRIAAVEESAGPRRTIAVYGPGEFTGDTNVVSGRPSALTALSHGDSQVLEISSDSLKRILSERPDVGDRIFEALIARRKLLEASGHTGWRVIGSRFSRDTFRIREFLAKHGVAYAWTDLEDNPDVDRLLASFQIEIDQTPVVFCGSEFVLRNPSNQQMAEHLGIRQPPCNAVYDLAIVGAGPAGLAAAVYGASEGLQTVVFERVAPGGQAGGSSRIENYLGFPTGISGADLVQRATLQAQKFGARLSSPAQVVSLGFEDAHVVLRLEGGERATALCVLIATGAEYRRLRVDNYERFENLGIYYAATSTEAHGCCRVPVVVIGGGNSAGQAAIFLAEQASKVWLLLRNDNLAEKMSRYLVRRIEQTANIEVLTQVEVTRVLGGECLTGVQIQDLATGKCRSLEASAVFPFIGAIPRTGWLPKEIARDEQGFIKTGRAAARSPRWNQSRPPLLLETSHAGVFAAGDVRSGSVKRVASAVGEGAMAVQFVHEYLDQL
jgi:thioredoxin reductase (NADPH)